MGCNEVSVNLGIATGGALLRASETVGLRTTITVEQHEDMTPRENVDHVENNQDIRRTRNF
jgi:hypothetical protein